MTASRPADEHTQIAAEVLARMDDNARRDRAVAAWVAIESSQDKLTPLLEHLAAAEQRGRDETARKVLALAEMWDGYYSDVAAELRRALADRNGEREGGR